LFLANTPQAHKWRCQTTRLLFPGSNLNADKSVRDIHNSYDARHLIEARRRASDFLNSPASDLLQSNSDTETIRKVNEIFCRAAAIATGVWTSDIILEISTLEDFELDVSFDTHDKRMIAHPLVDDPEDLQGRSIEMIVHPLVMVHGIEDGENDGEGRVWMPAEVWLPNEVIIKEEVDDGKRRRGS
jgi:hypothetical protein